MKTSLAPGKGLNSSPSLTEQTIRDMYEAGMERAVEAAKDYAVELSSDVVIDETELRKSHPYSTGAGGQDKRIGRSGPIKDERISNKSSTLQKIKTGIMNDAYRISPRTGEWVKNFTTDVRWIGKNKLQGTVGNTTMVGTKTKYYLGELFAKGTRYMVARPIGSKVQQKLTYEWAKEADKVHHETLYGKK